MLKFNGVLLLIPFMWCDLNTYHVKVQLFWTSGKTMLLLNLNTYHVKVQSNGISKKNGTENI